MRTSWIAAVAVLAGCTLATAGPPGRDPAADFHVPAGFVVEQVAAPPLVRYPLFAAFDDRGRLFVAEGTGTNLPGDELRARKLGRILVLEDRDGDGRFDASSVFADALVFPQGVLWHDGAVYCASHPSLWRLEDPDGKGVATRRRELVTGFGFNGNGCDLHGPFLGPDGRLYWTDGRHGYRVKTPEGDLLSGLAARVWRCRTDGTAVERVCGGGFDNPVEIDFTPDGEAIGTMDQGTGDCLLHYVEGGVYPMDHPCLAEFPRTGPLLGAVRPYSPVLPAALCGLARYRSRAFGEHYRGRFFSTQYMLHKVVRHDLRRDASTFRAEDEDFVTCDRHDVRLTDVLEDADGSLLLVDMGAWFTYGFPGNPPPRPEALGAIYRVRRAGAAAVVDPWGQALAIRTRPPAALIALLDDPRPRVRDRALARLSAIGAGAVPALSAALLAGATTPAGVRRDTAWALCRIGTAEAVAALRPALRDPDAGVRNAAVHALGLVRDPGAVAPLETIARDDDPPLRRKAAEALGRIGRPEAAPALLAGLKRGGDPFLEHSLIYALIRINDRDAALPALRDPDPRVRRGGLIALDQMAAGRLGREDVAPSLDADDPELRRVALDIVARRPPLASLSRDVLRRRLFAVGADATRDLPPAEVLLGLCDDPENQRAVADAVIDRKVPAATRARLLGMLGRSRLEPFPDRWLVAIGRLLTDPAPDPATLGDAVAAAKARGDRRFDPALVALAGREGLPPALRIAAIEGVAGRLTTLDAPAFALLSSHLSEDSDPMLRLAAARTLGASPLSGAQRLRLAETLAGRSAIVLRLLLPVFAKAGDPTVGAALVDALGRSASAEALGVSELDAALRPYPAEIQGRARPLREKLAARQRDQGTYLATLGRSLDALAGDPDAGHELFLSKKVGCFACHRAVGRGGEVGPDLSRIGGLRTRAELLESIVFPDLTIAPEYRSIQVATRDGRGATGLIVRDTPDAITLRTTELAEVVVARGDIEALAPTTRSLMPGGLERLLTRQELRDLLEFLVRQR